jgi:hypothetical protein
MIACPNCQSGLPDDHFDEAACPACGFRPTKRQPVPDFPVAPSALPITPEPILADTEADAAAGVPSPASNEAPHDEPLAGESEPDRAPAGQWPDDSPSAPVRDAPARPQSTRASERSTRSERTRKD